MESTYVTIHAVFGALGLLFWFGAGLYYWRSVSSDRLTYMVAAVQKEQQYEEEQEHLSANDKRIAQWKLKGQYVDIFIRFLQTLALVFMDSIPWPTAVLSDFGNSVSLSLGVSTTLAFFWLFAALYLITGAVTLSRVVYQKRRDCEDSMLPPYEKMMHELLLNTLFISASGRFLDLVHCITPEDDDGGGGGGVSGGGGDLPVVATLPTMVCWHNEHIFYAFLVLAGMAVVYPAVLASSLRLNDEGGSKYFFIPQFRVARVMTELFLVAMQTFLYLYPLVCSTLLFVAFTAYFAVNLYIQPCLGSGRAINHFESASYAALMWAAVCAMIASGIDNHVNIASGLLLILIVPCGYGGYKLSEWWLEKLDTAKLKAMREAATSKDVEFQRRAYLDMSVLALGDANRKRIVETVIDSALPLLQDPKGDVIVRINIARTIATIISDPQYRNVMRDMNVAAPLMAMVSRTR